MSDFVQVKKEELDQLIALNRELKADIALACKALHPLFGSLAGKRPFAAMIAAATRLARNPDEFKQLGTSVSWFIQKYSPKTMAQLDAPQSHE